MLNPVQALVMAALLCVSAKGKREKGNYSKQAHGSIQVSPPSLPSLHWGMGCLHEEGGGVLEWATEGTHFCLSANSFSLCLFGTCSYERTYRVGQSQIGFFATPRETDTDTVFATKFASVLDLFCLLLPGCHFLAWWRAPFRLKPRRFWLIKFCTNCSLSCLFRDRRFPKLTQERGR